MSRLNKSWAAQKCPQLNEIKPECPEIINVILK